MIKGKFSKLVTKSCRSLRIRQIDVEDVQTFLITMYSSPNSRDGSDMVITVLESARSLDEIFHALSKHRLWDYINYYLLQRIIKEFASDDDELNHMMEQYQKDLTGHILTLRIQTYLDASHFQHPIATSESETFGNADVLALPPEQKQKLYKKLPVMCDANFDDYTIKYVTDLWQSLGKQFELPPLEMILHHIAEGGIPPSLVKFETPGPKKKVCCICRSSWVGDYLEAFPLRPGRNCFWKVM